MNAIWSGSHLQTSGGMKGPVKTPLRGYNNNGVINTSSPACIRHRHKYENYVPKNQRIQDICHHENEASISTKTKSTEELNKWRVPHQHGLRQSCSSCQIQINDIQATHEVEARRNSTRHHKHKDTNSISDHPSVDAQTIKRNRSPSAPHITYDHSAIPPSPWIEKERKKVGVENESRVNKWDNGGGPRQSKKKSSLGSFIQQPHDNANSPTSNDVVEGEMKYIFKETSV